MSSSTFNPFETREISPAHNDEWEAKRRVGRAINRLSEILMTSVPPVDELHAIADSLTATADRFETFPRLYGRLGFLADGNHGDFGELSHELNPLAGRSNPMAPPVVTWFEDELALGEVSMGWQYEGPPGYVHGGYVAAVFDQFMGMGQILGGKPGMTRTLDVTYHRPTPLNTTLKLVGRLDSQEGRKTRIIAEIFAEDTLTASCSGLFIEPREGMVRLPPKSDAE